MKKRKLTKKKKIMTVIGVLLLITLLTVGYLIFFTDNETLKEVKEKVEQVITQEPEKKLTIIDEDSNERTIAVMIDTNSSAIPNHTGLNDAYITYEILAEGGIVRMMALYKDVDTAEIGPVRSSRHYYLDYALENDAIYAHFGWSTKASNDINSLGVDYLNGITNASNAYERNAYMYAPHNVFTSVSALQAEAAKKGYSTTSDNEVLLNYTTDVVDLSKKEDAVVANNVSVKFSNYHTTTFTYDASNQRYYRNLNGKPHTDNITDEHYSVKNIIVTNIENYTMDSEGRQDLKNIGSGTGYYITNGYAIPITWEKSSRSSQTVYKDMNGNEIEVSDGNTAIEIQPVLYTATIN